MGKKSTTYWKDLLSKFVMRKHEVKLSSLNHAYKLPGLQGIRHTRGKGNYYPIKPHQMDVTAAVVTGIEQQSN